MLIKQGCKSKRRRMYFRESSKRDTDISPEEEKKRYDMAYFEYCSECMEKHSLQKGKCVRTLGVCRICGNDGFIHGRMSTGDELIAEFIGNGSESTSTN